MPEVPVNTLQSAFSRGEVSPFMFGRVDLAGWAQGLRTLRNATVRPEGSLMNRQGFGYTGNSSSNVAKSTILVPFTFSAQQSYVFEIGNLTAQVFSQGQVVNGPTSIPFTAIAFALLPMSQWQLYITTSAPHGLTLGANINISGVTGTGSFAALNGSQQVVAVLSTTQFAVVAKYGNTGTWGGGGGVAQPLTFVTPWAVADLPKLRWAQSADTLTVVHPKYPPYEIKRTSANSFTCLKAVYTGGPFLAQNTDGTTFVYASAVTGTVTLNATAPIFNANHVGALFQLTQQDLSTITPWEANKEVFGDPTGTFRRASLKNYRCVSPVSRAPGTSYATGSWIPSHTQGTQPDGDGNLINGLATNVGLNWQYQDSGFGVVLITAFVSPTQVTGVVQPNYVGGPGLLPQAVIGGPVLVQGPWTFSGDGSTVTFSPLTGATSTDSNKFYVTVNGVYMAPSLFTITGTTITFLSAPAAGSSNIAIKQIAGLGQTSYWAFGAFSVDQGYPSTVSYFPDRLVLAATPQQPVGVFGSQTSQYHNFAVSNPVVASDAFTVFLNARQLNQISDLIPLSDLIVGTSNILWRLWPGSTGTALSPLAIAATPQNYYGESPACAATLFGDSAVFPEFDGRRLRDMIYQFAFDKFMGQELTLYARHLIPFGTTFQRLAYKPDPSGQLIFGLRSDGQRLLVCTYLREQQVIGWGWWDTQGTFEDICVVPENTVYTVYAITNRLINGQQVRYIERLENREVTTLFDYQFLDCNFTYDGRNTSSTTMVLQGGTTWLAGDVATLSASSANGWATFLSTDVGNEIWLYDAAGNRSRALITAYTSSLRVTIRLKDPCPVTLQGLATATWTFARTSFTGASALAGTAVVGYVDGNVLGIDATGIVPNGQLVVGSNGTVSLQSAGGVVQIGLPYLSDFETLSLNEQGQQTIRMRSKTTPVIYLDVAEARNFLAGTDFETMYPNAERQFETYTAPINQQEGILWTRVPSALDSECHTCIRQNMPLPITIRGYIPQITVGEPVS